MSTRRGSLLRLTTALALTFCGMGCAEAPEQAALQAPPLPAQEADPPPPTPTDGEAVARGWEDGAVPGARPGVGRGPGGAGTGMGPGAGMGPRAGMGAGMGPGAGTRAGAGAGMGAGGPRPGMGGGGPGASGDPTERQATSRPGMGAPGVAPQGPPPGGGAGRPGGGPPQAAAGMGSGMSPLQIVYNNSRAVVRTPDGAVVTAWTDRGRSVVQRKGADGKVVETTLAATGGTSVAIESDGGENLVAAWGAGTPAALQARVSRDGGRTWSSPNPLPTGSGASQPALRVWSAGGKVLAVAAWHEGSRGGPTALYASTFDGATWSPAERVDTGTAEAAFPSLAGKGDTTWIVWRDNRTGARELYVASRTGVAVPFTGERSTGVAGMDPSLCVDGAGTLHLAFHKMQQVYYAQSADGAQTFGAPVLLDSSGLFGRMLCSASNDKLAVVWEDMLQNGNQRDDANKTLGLAVSTDRGRSFRVVDVVARKVNQILPSASLAPDGTIDLFWVDKAATQLQQQAVRPW